MRRKTAAHNFKEMKLIVPEKGSPVSQGDPYIFKANGKYYLYATGVHGVETYASDRLLSGWKYIGRTLTEPDRKEFWAPCVIERDGTYYMYYSSMPKEEDDVHLQEIRVAVSASPESPFVYQKSVLPPFSIDPHVVRSGDGYYIFYSLNDAEAERAGTYIAVDKLTDMFTVEGKPKAVVLPTLDEEIFMHDRFRKGQNWHTVEGAFYFRKGDDHYVTYSGNCYQNEKYFLGYAYAHGKETDLRELKFEKQPSENVYAPLICRNESEEGTGHNSVIEEDGTYDIVYHARDLTCDRTLPDCRTARICPLHAEGKLLKAERSAK